jgi:hypothetical protein
MPPTSARSAARPCLELLEGRCLLSPFGLGPTVQVSGDDPFAGSTADDPQHQTGTLYPGTSLETFLVSDPNYPDHLVGIWQQDRWSNGGSRGLVVGISWDGGQSWYDEPLPGVGLVSGGTTARASDPWVAFAADGTLFATALTVSAQGSVPNVVVSTSADGGYTWQGPVAIPNSSGADKESIVTEPYDPLTAYVVWTGAFSRTTDGGQNFSPAQPLPTGTGSQIVVLPDDTLLDTDGRQVFRSTDQGQHWGPRILLPNSSPRQVTDPNTHQSERAGLGIPDIAVDPNSGTVYRVIEDANFSGGRYDGIALTTSTDGGLTWSRPVKVNQTPTDVPALDQQAFLPTVQVSADGTVAVTYYDFRFNQQGPALPTDYWLVWGTPDGSGGITWGDEQRLTDTSFNFEDAPFSVYGNFVGDYQGRASSGTDLLNLFGHPDGGSGDVIFFRRAFDLGGGRHAPPGGGGGLESAAQDLAALLRVGPAAVPSPVALAPDRPAVRPLPVAVPAGADLWLGGLESSAARFTRAGRGPRLAAPSPPWDGAVPALPSGDLESSF